MSSPPTCPLPAPAVPPDVPRAGGTFARPLLRGGLAVGAAALVVGLGLPPAAALALGVAVAMAVGSPEWAPPLGQGLLKLGVIGLGAGLDLVDVLRAGLDGLGATCATLGGTLTLGAWLTRRLRVGADVGALVTVGTAICGASAIAAAAPALRARSGDVGVALGVVFALNAAALAVFPAVGRALDLDPLAYGRWCALAIHDTSSVVGAAAAFGPDALELATITKLARALWIVPVVLALGALRAWRSAAPGAPPRPKPPLFIAGFVAAAALVTCAPSLAPAGRCVAGAAHEVLLLALLVLGLGTSASRLRGAGGRPLALGVTLWLATSAASLALVATLG